MCMNSLQFLCLFLSLASQVFSGAPFWLFVAFCCCCCLISDVLGLGTGASCLAAAADAIFFSMLSSSSSPMARSSNFTASFPFFEFKKFKNHPPNAVFMFMSCPNYFKEFINISDHKIAPPPASFTCWSALFAGNIAFGDVPTWAGPILGGGGRGGGEHWEDMDCDRDEINEARLSWEWSRRECWEMDMAVADDGGAMGMDETGGRARRCLKFGKISNSFSIFQFLKLNLYFYDVTNFLMVNFSRMVERGFRFFYYELIRWRLKPF